MFTYKRPNEISSTAGESFLADGPTNEVLDVYVSFLQVDLSDGKKHWCLHATLTAFNSNTSYCFVFYSCNRILGILLSLTLNPSLLQITGNLNSSEDFFSLILLIQ